MKGMKKMQSKIKPRQSYKMTGKYPTGKTGKTGKAGKKTRKTAKKRGNPY